MYIYMVCCGRQYVFVITSSFSRSELVTPISVVYCVLNKDDIHLFTARLLQQHNEGRSNEAHHPPGNFCFGGTCGKKVKRYAIE